MFIKHISGKPISLLAEKNNRYVLSQLVHSESILNA